MDFKRVKINQPSKDVVYGYIKQAQTLLPNESAYFNIVELIRKIILFYYYIPFEKHMTLQDALELQVSDQIDYRDSFGRFCEAEIVEKDETSLKIHYIGWDNKWDVHADSIIDIHQFAKFGSISKRPTLNHRFKGTPPKRGDCININPNTSPGWKCGKFNRFEEISGQVYISFDCYKSKNVKSYVWSHLDNEQEILPMFDFEKSKKCYTDAITADNTNATHIYNYAIFLFRNKLYQLALDQFLAALKLNPFNAKPMIQCALCYEKLNNFDSAKKCFLEAIEIDNGKSDQLFYSYALFLFRNKLYELALDQLLAALKLNSSNSKAMIQCAHCYEELGNLDSAKKYFLKAIEIDNGKSDDMKDKRQAGNYYLYALLLQRNNDFIGAVKYVKKTIRIIPHHVKACYTLARLLRDDMKEYKEAEEYYLKLIDINKNAYKGSYGYLLYLMGKYDKAMQCILSAMEDNPVNFWTHFYHGLVNNALGNNEEADNELLKVSEMIKLKIDKQLIFINKIKQADLSHVEYYDKLIQLIEKKRDQCDDEIAIENNNDNADSMINNSNLCDMDDNNNQQMENNNDSL